MIWGVTHTVFVGEDGRAHSAGPHSERRCDLAGHLRVAGQVLPQATLVHVKLAAHRAWMVGVSALG